MLFQLTYFSKAIENILSSDLEKILAESITANEAKNITGCLVFYKMRFFQILEGAEADVLYIYDKIVKDARHTNIKLLDKGTSKKRLFPDWSMCYHAATETNNVDLDYEQFKRNLFLLTNFIPAKTSTDLQFLGEIKKSLFN